MSTTEEPTAAGEVTAKESTEAEPAPQEDPKVEPGEPKAEGAPAQEAQQTEEEEEVEEEEPDDGVPRVLVTGASGFIASVLTKALLEDGRFRVRGTVRSKKKKEKIQPLLDLVPDSKYPLRLIEADLQKPESWARAVKSCSYVFHLASPFPPPQQRLADDEVIRPAVDGTLNVLKACAEAGTVKRVIMTSSVAAVSNGMGGSPSKPRDYVYSETDWSEESECALYERSKLLAERAAWDYMKTLEEDKKFELVVLNPSYVQGPLLSKASGEGSQALCGGLLNGKFPALLNISFPIVDVRDVVAAIVAAMEKSEAAGNRYVLFTGNLTLKETAMIVREEFGTQGYKITTTVLPKAIAWLGKLFDSTMKATYPMIDKVITFNNEKMVGELGVTPRPLKDTIIETCYSLIELGLARKTPGYLGLPSTRPAKEEPPTATEEQPKPDETSAEPEAAKPDETSAEPEAAKPDETSAEPEAAKPDETSAEPEAAKPDETSAEPEADKPEETSAEPQAAKPEETSAEPEPDKPDETSTEPEAGKPEETSAEPEPDKPDETSAEPEPGKPDEASAEPEPVVETEKQSTPEPAAEDAA